jgi:hypothetical protein
MRPLLVALLVAGGVARAERDPGLAALEARRDAIIERIAGGEELGRVTRDYAALLDERARYRTPEEQAQERRRAEERREHETAEWRRAYRRSADYHVGIYCRLPVDPARPGEGDPVMLLADWGKVVRRETLPRPAVGSFGPTMTMYEVAGARQRYRFYGERFSFASELRLDAKPGDLVLVCEDVRPPHPPGLATVEYRQWLPPSWQGAMLDGYAVQFQGPPRTAALGRRDYVHVNDVILYRAQEARRWPYPPERPVLARVEVVRALEGGRYELENGRRRWILEAPASVPGVELLVPGRMAWALMRAPRFDTALGTLVMTAERVVERLVE